MVVEDNKDSPPKIPPPPFVKMTCHDVCDFEEKGWSDSVCDILKAELLRFSLVCQG